MVIIRNLFLAYLFLFTSVLSSQNKALVAEYTYSNRSSNRIEVLIANETEGFYQVLNKKALEKSTPKTELKDGSYTISGLKNSTFSNFIFLNVSDTLNYSYLKTQNQEMMVLDEMPKLEWKLLKEDKLIDKYICKKAEVQFRGRKFTAWYAPEIAVPFGPFKFKGLPGLIINVESTYNGSTLYWNLTSLKYDNSIVVPNKSDFEGKEFTLREVLTNETNERNDRSKRTLAKMGRGIRQTKVTLERLGAERIYEWETKNEENK
ncbi:MAG: GLPGLI family protein [Mariniflexile sp.]|jgi:GLPGLI family protein|uniref:GLPGLI family protein n=1 Tax=Nonlabens sp. TaxID=1888209 RepID=UPI0039E623E8